MLIRENVNNEASKDSSVLRFVELQEACGPDDHMCALEGKLSKWSTESK